MSKIIVLDVVLLKEIGLQLFNAFVLFFIMTKGLYKPVSKFMAKRKEAIEEEIKDANSIKEEALKLKQEYEERLNKIQQEADEILTTAHKKAVETENELIKKAKIEAIDIKNKAKADIEMYEEQAKDVIKREIIDVSAMVANKMIKISIDEDKHNKLIEETIKEIGDVKWLA